MKFKSLLPNLLLLLLIPMAAVLVISFSVDPVQTADESVATPEGVLGESEQRKVSIDSNLSEKKYTLRWVKVDASKVDLIANFDEKLTAREAKSFYSCDTLVSGGFYTIESQPTGLFIASGTKFKEYVPNKTLNGVLSINDFDTPRITYDVPRDRLIQAVQTGPVIKHNASYQNVNTTSDKFARRILAATTGKNELYFIVVHESNSPYSGPLLSELPEVLEKFELQSDINIADAVNLDGGSASAFITKDTNLTEISPIGSIFCEQ